jgi:ubiquinone/menaquinone biosynthesis C-methylase UbiE
VESGRDNPEDSRLVEDSLARPDIHELWETAYRTSGNERFYELAFDRLLDLLRPPAGATFLDAGCGPGFHAIRLARRGFRVVGIDFSEAILDQARANVERFGLADAISLQREDLTELSFGDAEFGYVLCWGVLMHVPDVSRAVAELSRVTAPGGRVVVAEGNTRSLDATGVRLLARGGREGRSQVVTPAGIENWKDTSGGRFMTRIADIGWLQDEFAGQGLRVVDRLPAQFTELHTKLRWEWATRIVHRANELWFRRVRRSGPASGNILVLERAERT